MDFAEGFGLVGMIFLIYAAVLAFFLPFYVMGIYNQSKEINNNLQTTFQLLNQMNENLQTMSSLLADALDKNNRFSGKGFS
ncbi:uncharacterized protein METZ01_LOCUS510875 [marine metagenome]|uniref:Uncharacterized protein n=1 Tax=marine metagenome TaxID=408172 RepID=A0A383EMM0_9ZZZZ